MRRLEIDAQGAPAEPGMTTTIGEAVSSPTASFTRKRFPSGVTSYWRPELVVGTGAEKSGRGAPKESSVADAERIGTATICPSEER